MAIQERDKSIQIMKDKLILCYDSLNIWFSVYTSRKSTSVKSKTGIVEAYEDMGYFNAIDLACKYTLELEKDNKILTNKMQKEIEILQSGITDEVNKTNALIENIRVMNTKEFKNALNKYLTKKLQGKKQSFELQINDDLMVTLNKGYIYFSCRFKVDETNGKATQEYRWVDMGYYPFVWQGYWGLHKKLLLKAINENPFKDIKAFVKLVNKTERDVRDLIQEADIKIKKEIKFK